MSIAHTGINSYRVIEGEGMSFRCPYVDEKVYCDRRESIDDETYVCDSCIVLFPDMYEDVSEEGEE